MTSETSQPESGLISFEVRSPGAIEAEAPAAGPFSFDAPLPDSFEFEPPRADSDRRVRPRGAMRVQARICLDGEPPLDVHTVDLSPHGLAITATRPLNVDQECRIELGISAPEIAPPPALRASVRYCARLRDDQFRIGMKFTAVSVEAAELIVMVLEL